MKIIEIGGFWVLKNFVEGDRKDGFPHRCQKSQQKCSNVCGVCGPSCTVHFDIVIFFILRPAEEIYRFFVGTACSGLLFFLDESSAAQNWIVLDIISFPSEVGDKVR